MRKLYKNEKLLYRYLYKQGQKYRYKFVQTLDCKSASSIAQKWLNKISKIYHKVFKALKCKSPADTTFAGFDEFVYCSSTGIADTVSDHKSVPVEEDANMLAEFKELLTTENLEEMFWDIFDIYDFLKVCRLNGLNYWTGEEV